MAKTLKKWQGWLLFGGSYGYRVRSWIALLIDA